MSKPKDTPSTETETEEEYSVEKVLDRRVVKGKVKKTLSESRFFVIHFIHNLNFFFLMEAQCHLFPAFFVFFF